MFSLREQVRNKNKKRRSRRYCTTRAKDYGFLNYPQFNKVGKSETLKKIILHNRFVDWLRDRNKYQA